MGERRAHRRFRHGTLPSLPTPGRSSTRSSTLRASRAQCAGWAAPSTAART
jgi:hypothetical protein